RTGFFPAQPRNPTPRRAGRLDGYHSLRTDSKASFSDFWWAKRISSPVSVVFVLAGPQVLWITAPSPIAPARATVCGEKHGSRPSVAKEISTFSGLGAGRANRAVAPEAVRRQSRGCAALASLGLLTGN